MRFSRYAVYVTLPPGPLATFGAAWLGWDSEAGQPVAPQPIAGLPRPVADLTARPRKYGLHGTIKPPFRLAEGQNFERLCTAFDTFCRARSPVLMDGLALARIGRFLALVPTGDTAALAALAARAVEGLDPFRAALTGAELEKRRQSRLTDRQDALLQRWGYPYVMQDFRFHITLTGPLPHGMADEIRAILDPHLMPLLPKPFVIDALALCGEDEDGRFHVIHRHPLTAESA